MTDMPTLDRLDELTLLIEHGEAVYLRYSPGPEADATHPSKDHESGLLMSGVSANPLRPPRWWTRPPEDWVARAVCQYIRELDEGARPWVLTGRVVDFGPDNEPLLAEVQPIAWLSDELLAAARRHYREQLAAGQATHPG
jgi:hypothetical protein